MIAYAPEKNRRTLGELLADLGVAADRVRLQPPPGSATIDDVLCNPRCELIDGTLVEKAMGLKESLLASFLIEILGAFVRRHRLGKVTAPDGTFRLMPNLVRIPDVAFISWDRLPNRRIPDEPAPSLAPDLAIEVLSEGNTIAEIERKLREYFQAGVREVWIVDRFDSNVRIYTSAADFRTLHDTESIEGSGVVPDFQLSIAELFAEIQNDD